jgi:hypothetical protein
MKIARLPLLCAALILSALAPARASNPNCPTALLCTTAQAACNKPLVYAFPSSLCDDSLGQTWNLWRYACTNPQANGVCLKP